MVRDLAIWRNKKVVSLRRDVSTPSVSLLYIDNFSPVPFPPKMNRPLADEDIDWKAGLQDRGFLL